MKKTFFDDNERYMPDAQEFDQRAEEALGLLIQEFKRRGYTIREMIAILQHVVMSSTLIELI